MLKQKNYLLYCGTKVIGKFKLADILEVELTDGLNQAQVPIDFHRGYFKGERRFIGDVVNTWIIDRAIPPERHNIYGILEEMGLDEYDELGMFLYCNGQYVGDDFRIELIQ